MNPKDLPVWEIMSLVLAALKGGKNLVVTAPPGSGKTTQIPQAIHASGLAKQGLTIIVQPRRVACRAAARRVAEEMKVEIGREVGYMVRYDRKISPGTRILFVTDGVLMRFLEQDSQLTVASVVIFDEFHERRMLTDLALGLLRQAQQRRTSLRLVVMSATLETKAIGAYLDADTVSAGGKLYPVNVKHGGRSPLLPTLPRETACHIRDVLRSDAPGDILVFLPGKGEINRTAQELKRMELLANIVLLHGDLDPKEQDRVFAPGLGRKVILATNIAETSLTIPGVRTVIDTGWERRASFDPESGANILRLHRISKASAEQRAGRAGREGVGLCIRLWSGREHASLESAPPSEIQRSDIASVVLTLKSIGVKQVEDFPFLEGPTTVQMETAHRFLQMLGALDEAGELTPIGWQMLRLPLTPRYARMVVEAERSRCLGEVASIAALMAGRPVFQNDPKQKEEADNNRLNFARDDASDFFTLLQVFHLFRATEYDAEWTEENFLNHEALQEAKRVRHKIIAAAFQRGSKWNHGKRDRASILRCIATGLVDRLAKRLPSKLYLLANGTVAKLDGDTIVNGEYVLAAQLRLVTGKGGQASTLLSLLTKVDLKLMQQVAPQLFQVERGITAYFPETQTAQFREVKRYMELTLDSSERLVSLNEAWRIQFEMTQRAAAQGYQRIEVQLRGSNACVALVNGREIPVSSAQPGAYWASVSWEGKRSVVKLHGRIFNLPTPKVQGSLSERFQHLTSAVAKLTGE